MTPSSGKGCPKTPAWRTNAHRQVDPAAPPFLLSGMSPHPAKSRRQFLAVAVLFSGLFRQQAGHMLLRKVNHGSKPRDAACPRAICQKHRKRARGIVGKTPHERAGLQRIADHELRQECNALACHREIEKDGEVLNGNRTGHVHGVLFAFPIKRPCGRRPIAAEDQTGRAREVLRSGDGMGPQEPG